MAGTGYAIVVATGEQISYEEADKRQAAEIADPNVTDTYQYLSGDGKSITSWSGGSLMRITQHGIGRNGFHGSEVHYLRAVAPDGSHWYGKNGGPGMCVHMRRAKG